MTAAVSSKIELLAPAGSFEKLEAALHYGADAVYLAGRQFSLRNYSENFSTAEMKEAIALAHRKGARVYVAVNIYPRNTDLPALTEALARLARLNPDGLIAADPAVIRLAGQHAPDLPLHLSTQANTTNVQSALFWQQMGVRRINAARELSLDEITELAAQTDLEIEAFVHGAMCMAHSGRCLLSNYLTGRDSNRGRCCQPCRFRYAVVEQMRPGQYYPLAEDSHGTYIFNSKDLCMIEHLPAMIAAGINSLKIEGRMKSVHYVATTVKVYREAVDAFYQNPHQYKVLPCWIEDLELVNTRGFCTGFYFGNPSDQAVSFAPPRAGRQVFAAKVLAVENNHCATIDVRNKLSCHDPVALISPGKPACRTRIHAIWDRDGCPLSVAQPGCTVTVDLGIMCRPMDLLRRIAASSEG